MNEEVSKDFLSRLTECRELTRPVRRRTHYSSMKHLQNGLRRLKEAADRLDAICNQLMDDLDAVREHAQRERLSRR